MVVPVVHRLVGQGTAPVSVGRAVCWLATGHRGAVSGVTKCAGEGDRAMCPGCEPMSGRPGLTNSALITKAVGVEYCDDHCCGRVDQSTEGEHGQQDHLLLVWVLGLGRQELVDGRVGTALIRW